MWKIYKVKVGKYFNISSIGILLNLFQFCFVFFFFILKWMDYKKILQEHFAEERFLFFKKISSNSSLPKRDKKKKERKGISYQFKLPRITRQIWHANSSTVIRGTKRFEKKRHLSK